MDFATLMDGLVWAFQPSAFFTRGTLSRMMHNSNTILHQLRFDRIRSGYHPCRRDYLHRGCCNVSDLLKEIRSWLSQWPAVMAALVVAAEGTHLHEGILNFRYALDLAKHVCRLFTFSSTMFNEGEWMNPQEALDMLLPMEREAREMVEARRSMAEARRSQPAHPVRFY
jgi:hypothetical protein